MIYGIRPTEKRDAGPKNASIYYSTSWASSALWPTAPSPADTGSGDTDCQRVHVHPQCGHEGETPHATFGLARVLVYIRSPPPLPRTSLKNDSRASWLMRPGRTYRVQAQQGKQVTYHPPHGPSGHDEALLVRQQLGLSHQHQPHGLLIPARALKCAVLSVSMSRRRSFTSDVV